jgi:hypothetical protein
MGINMYVINAILVLMVIGRVGEHPLDLRFLAVPVLAVGAAVLFLRSAPVGSDIMLEAACVASGASWAPSADWHPTGSASAPAAGC